MLPFKVIFPPASSVRPAPTKRVPVVRVVVPLLRLMIPVLASMVPLLLNGLAVIALVPVPPDLTSTPSLLKPGPPPYWTIETSEVSSTTPPGRLTKLPHAA